MSDNDSTSPAAGGESLPEGFTLMAGGGMIHQARFSELALRLFGGTE